MGYAAIVGAAMDIAGTAINAGEADSRKEAMQRIANTPGLDFGAITKGALEGYSKNFGAANKLSGQLSTANQAQLNAQEEQALPGLGAARQSALGKISGLFADDATWLKGVQRRGAALGLSSGLMGSQAGQLQTLRLSDQEQMQRTALGTGLLGSLIGSMRLANTPGVQAFIGPSMSEQLNTRSTERTQKLNMLTGANALPSGLEVWGNRLQQVGSTLMGGGIGGGMGSTGFGGGGGADNGISGAQNQNMRNEYYGMGGEGTTGGFGY